MQTSTNDHAHRHLARAWALLDQAEQLARQAVQNEAGPSPWLLAANSILRVRDSMEAIHPFAPTRTGSTCCSTATVETWFGLPSVS